MPDLFLKIVNMSIAASYLVLAVFLLRLILKNAPRWIFVLLWGIVALRLLCPFSIESSMSLIPSAQPIPESVLSDSDYHVQTDIPVKDGAVDDYIGGIGDEDQSGPNHKLENIVFFFSIIWALGMLQMVGYTVFSYLRLHRRVATAIRYRDGVFISEEVVSPFILGIFSPRIYLPYGLDDGEVAYILSHEQAHIKRKDHWWKPLGFLLLTIHWFNPLMWVAYCLLCRDIEQACDEKVVCEFESKQRADYSQTLLKCSVNRHTIAACPLAFGELGVKERVKNVLSYKKPAFFMIVLAIIACIVLAVCFLTDPVSADKLGLRQPSQPLPNVTGQPGELLPSQNVPGPAGTFYPISMMTSEWSTGTFQLDAFPDVTFSWGDGKIEAVTGNKTALLFETEKLYNLTSADLNMDGYPEICVTTGADPGAAYVIVYDFVAGKAYTFGYDPYERYLYTRGGYLMCAVDSLFAGETVQAGRLMLIESALVITAPWQIAEYDGNAVVWFNKNHPDSPIRGEVQLDAFPGAVFRWDHTPNVLDASERLVVERDGEKIELFTAGSAESVYVADVTGDGKPDICANVYFHFSGVPSYNAVFVYDYVNDTCYMLADSENIGHNTKISYYVGLEDDKLICQKIHEATDQVIATGTLFLADAANGKQLCLQEQVTYQAPVYYEFDGDNNGQDRVKLTVCGDGTCDISFNPRLNDDFTIDCAQGTYIKENGKLIMTTEDGETYAFRFEGEDLVFMADESDALPDDCMLYDGSVLEAHPYFS